MKRKERERSFYSFIPCVQYTDFATSTRTRELMEKEDAAAYTWDLRVAG